MLKFIIIFIVVLIILVIGLLIYLKNIKKTNENKTISESFERTVVEGIYDIENIDIYCVVESIINNYVKDNTNKGNNTIIINSMKQKDLTEDVTAVFVNYDVIKASNNVENLDIVVNLDQVNETYSVIPNKTEKDNIEIVKSISNNGSNTYTIKQLETKDIAEKYFSDYIKKIIYKPEDAYKILKEEHKKEKYDTYEKFKQYIDKKLNQYKNAKMKEYTENYENENYIEYTCVDQYNNVYKFYEKTQTKFEVILDNKDVN